MRRIRVKGHYSTRNGRRYYVKPHYMQENRHEWAVLTAVEGKHLYSTTSSEKAHEWIARQNKYETYQLRSPSGSFSGPYASYPTPRFSTKENKRFEKWKKKNNKYALGESLRFTKKHPGYSKNLGIYQNVEKGHEYNRKERFPYLETGRQLQAIANLNTRINPRVASHFSEAAKEAFRLHEERECPNGKCTHRR